MSRQFREKPSYRNGAQFLTELFNIQAHRDPDLQKNLHKAAHMLAQHLCTFIIKTTNQDGKLNIAKIMLQCEDDKTKQQWQKLRHTMLATSSQSLSIFKERSSSR